MTTTTTPTSITPTATPTTSRAMPTAPRTAALAPPPPGPTSLNDVLHALSEPDPSPRRSEARREIVNLLLGEPAVQAVLDIAPHDPTTPPIVVERTLAKLAARTVGRCLPLRPATSGRIAARLR